MSPLPLLLLSALAPFQSEAQPSLQGALAAGESVMVEQTLFILNEEIVTLSMIQESAARILRQNPPGMPPEDALSIALRDHVHQLVALEGFRRLGMDETLLEEEVTARMDRIIEGAGSRARFEEGLRESGFTMVTYRDFLKNLLIQRTWRGVVTGEQPSPLQGFRSRLEPTPSELRAEFDTDPRRWEQGFELVWEVLQFHDGAQGPGLARAQAIADGLGTGAVTLADAKAAAQSVATNRGDPASKNLLPKIRDFLLDAEVGDVSPVEPIPNLGGLIFVVTERSPARTIGFEEAQFRIAVDLRERKAEALVADAAAALLRSSYTWYPAELNDFMSGLFGVAGPPRETEF